MYEFVPVLSAVLSNQHSLRGNTIRYKNGHFGVTTSVGIGSKALSKKWEWIVGMLKPHIFLLIVQGVVGNDVGKIIWVQIVRSLNARIRI